MGFTALALDFHLKDGIGGFPIADPSVCQQGDEAVLEGLKAALNFAFGLRCWGHEVCDVKRPQGALELATWIGVMIVGTRSEKAQGVGIDGFRQAVALEGLAKMLEVIPGGVALDEAPRNKQARAVIDGKQQGLFVWSRPPLVD